MNNRQQMSPYHQQEMLTIISNNIILPPPPEPPAMTVPAVAITAPSPLSSHQPEMTGLTSTSGAHTRCGNSSFPAHIIFHRALGLSIFFASIISIITIACKSCDQAVIYEPESRDLLIAQSTGNMDRVVDFVSSYYFMLHSLHICILFGSVHILVLGSFDLVPKHDTDCRFGFHFVSVFIIFIVAGVSIYSTYIAYTSPCQSLGECCSVVSSPGLLSPGDKPALTAFSQQDIQMLQVMALDITAFLCLTVVGVVYFRDVRRIASDSGYLHRVHNEGYIIREL